MEDLESTKSGLFRVVGRFPRQAIRVRQLYQQSHAFRALCDDYVLAQDTLAKFERAPGQAHVAEIADYSCLIPELEAEIADHLSRPDDNTPLGDGANFAK